MVIPMARAVLRRKRILGRMPPIRRARSLACPPERRIAAEHGRQLHADYAAMADSRRIGNL
jgi:hypothetical protein